ncbi:MAG: hypothetical protein L0Z62_05985, partial [Gemmataceae bacterium]|nr:hypothetical protein [Gemmataceae bacterium]
MNVRTKLGSLIALCCVLGISVLLSGSALQVPSGTWQATGTMSESRDGAAAVALQDGRVLVIGGDNGSGPTASVDVFGATGVFSAGPNMLSARSGHTATVLSDGRVLVVGGTGTGGALASAEIYDPANDSWSNAGSLSTARSGHTATLLPDGGVLIAGGGSASLEIYDPNSNSFSDAGSLSSDRTGHAAAILGRWPAADNRLVDRQVIIVGGSNGASVLSSTEIYDPATGQVSAGPALPGPRTGASAVTVLGGFAYVAGGNDGSNDLSSALLISRDGDVTAAPDLLAPRSGHFAVRLPGANSVLIAGGSAGTSAEIFVPWTDPQQQIATGSMGSSRAGAASASVSRGLYLAAGGSGSSSSEVYGYATVDTDKNDYFPGEAVNVSGSGWQAGETVNLVLHEDIDPEFHPDITGSAVADGAGNISAPGFYTVEQHDLGVRFFLTASGATSNHQARATFTDAPPAIDLEQCRNGLGSSPNDCLDLGGGSGWVTGNVGASQAHLVEGWSIPYRAVLTDLPAGTHVELILGYDIKHSDRHAIDYLTHFQRLDNPSGSHMFLFGHDSGGELVDPDDGVTLANPGTTTLADIPVPDTTNSPVPGQPATSFNALPAAEKKMTLFGATFENCTSQSAAIVYETQGDLTASQAETRIRVCFLTGTNAGDAVLAWGGHIGSRNDWGFDDMGVPRSAGGISGSPYHMRVINWNLNNEGNQDRSLAAAAVFAPSSIKIIKEADPEGTTDFTFATTSTGSAIAASFMLEDNNDGGDDACTGGNCPMMRLFDFLAPGTYTFDEQLPSGWTFQGIVCTQSGGVSTIAEDEPNQKVTITLVAGSNVICTFSNQARGSIKIVKDAVPNDAQNFAYTGSGPSGFNFGGGFSLDDDGSAGSDACTSGDCPMMRTFSDLVLGSYTVTETLPVTGWDFTSLVCNDDDNAGGLISGASATLQLDPGETITCTYTNKSVSI